MHQLVTKSEQSSQYLNSQFNSLNQSEQRELVKQELRRRIGAALQRTQGLLPADRLTEVRQRLMEIQTFCDSRQKTFIFVEQLIVCAEYSLGGGQERATLFRGPSADASVAICVSDRGSVLHRNGGPWQIYCDEGDVNPIQCLQASAAPATCIPAHTPQTTQTFRTP